MEAITEAILILDVVFLITCLTTCAMWGMTFKETLKSFVEAQRVWLFPRK